MMSGEFICADLYEERTVSYTLLMLPVIICEVFCRNPKHLQSVLITLDIIDMVSFIEYINFNDKLQKKYEIINSP